MEWHSRNELPEPDHWCIVEDENGNQHKYHMHNGICWYDYIIHEGICDGWRSDVSVQKWRYDAINRSTGRCLNYCGAACVDGTCPIANRDEYIERNIPVGDCEDCHYYKGCKDCYFFENPICYCDGHGNFREDE